jgi:hypothetical protein
VDEVWEYVWQLVQGCEVASKHVEVQVPETAAAAAAAVACAISKTKPLCVRVLHTLQVTTSYCG